MSKHKKSLSEQNLVQLDEKAAPNLYNPLSSKPNKEVLNT